MDTWHPDVLRRLADRAGHSEKLAWLQGLAEIPRGDVSDRSAARRRRQPGFARSEWRAHPGQPGATAGAGRENRCRQSDVALILAEWHISSDGPLRARQLSIAA